MANTNKPQTLRIPVGFLTAVKREKSTNTSDVVYGYSENSELRQAKIFAGEYIPSAVHAEKILDNLKFAKWQKIVKGTESVHTVSMATTFITYSREDIAKILKGYETKKKLEDAIAAEKENAQIGQLQVYARAKDLFANATANFPDVKTEFKPQDISNTHICELEGFRVVCLNGADSAPKILVKDKNAFQDDKDAQSTDAVLEIAPEDYDYALHEIIHFNKKEEAVQALTSLYEENNENLYGIGIFQYEFHIQPLSAEEFKSAIESDAAKKSSRQAEKERIRREAIAAEKKNILANIDPEIADMLKEFDLDI